MEGESENAATVSQPAAKARETSAQETVIQIQHDPDELMSLYSVFKANIGFNDPIKVCHFLATGVAAVVLLSDEKALNALKADVGLCDSRNSGARQ
ncbi:hypothetical protein C2W62_26155 [Candidatus Entotheonella serta]|nr:hypothetical protein C2W62_26155 [Candidatus Entotheonella serta]